jgi:flagellar biosynthesis protein FlhA
LEQARQAGYTVVDPVTIISTHLSEFARRYAHELFSRQDAKRLLDSAAADSPKLVEDLVPKLLPLASVQRVLQNLLRERVSIRDTGSILEALSEAAASTRNPILLTEFVRQSIRRAVVKPYLNKAGELPAYLLDGDLDRIIESAVEHGEQSSHINASPETIHRVVSRMEKVLPKPEAPVVLISGATSRFFLRQIVENSMPNLAVLSHNEMPPELKVVSLGVVQ